MTDQIKQYDPYDSADNPEPIVYSNEYWGQMMVTVAPVVLVKGTGKVPFDPAQHKPEQRRTSVEMSLVALPEMKMKYSVDRNTIAENREWLNITLPSLKALGLGTRQLNNAWVHAKLKETGETYNGSDGQTHTKTAFEFLQTFASEDFCRAAYLEHLAGDGTVQATQAAQTAPAAPNGNKERETAQKFLPVIVENACRGQSDLKVIRDTIAANLPGFPIVAKYFTVDSPETANLILEKMAK